MGKIFDKNSFIGFMRLLYSGLVFMRLILFFMKKTSELIWQDKQHQELFKLIDLIDSSNVDARVFRRLHDYAENHFMLEEEYMLRLEYAHFEEHKRAHDKFRTELDSMIQECANYDEKFRQALSVFLSEWLKGHIFGIDKQLEDYILKSDYK